MLTGFYHDDRMYGRCRRNTHGKVARKSGRPQKGSLGDFDGDEFSRTMRLGGCQISGSGCYGHDDLRFGRSASVERYSKQKMSRYSGARVYSV